MVHMRLVQVSKANGPFEIDGNHILNNGIH